MIVPNVLLDDVDGRVHVQLLEGPAELARLWPVVLHGGDDQQRAVPALVGLLQQLLVFPTSARESSVSNPRAC